MLAVLPFEHLSGEPDRDYLADGLWEEMVVALDKIDPQRVGVLGRSSIRDYERSLKSPAALGRELGADYLVDSSIPSEKGRLRIVAKLIQVAFQARDYAAALDSQLWIGHMMRGQALERMDRDGLALDALIAAADFQKATARRCLSYGSDHDQ